MGSLIPQWKDCYKHGLRINEWNWKCPLFTISVVRGNVLGSAQLSMLKTYSELFVISGESCVCLQKSKTRERVKLYRLLIWESPQGTVSVDSPVRLQTNKKVLMQQLWQDHNCLNTPNLMWNPIFNETLNVLSWVQPAYVHDSELPLSACLPAAALTQGAVLIALDLVLDWHSAVLLLLLL